MKRREILVVRCMMVLRGGGQRGRSLCADCGGVRGASARCTYCRLMKGQGWEGRRRGAGSLAARGWLPVGV